MSYGKGSGFGTGWSTFAGIFLFIAGVFNVMDGLVAIFQKEYFNEGGLVYENLQAWGWTFLILGIIQVIVGWLVLSRAAAGRWLGVVIASLSMMASFFAIGAYPLWAIMTMVIDGVIVWGLTAKWGEE
jgi:hypothetical protein